MIFKELSSDIMNLKNKIKKYILLDFIYEELVEWNTVFLRLAKAIDCNQSEDKTIREAERCYGTITWNYAEYFWFNSFREVILAIEQKFEDYIISLDTSYSYDPINCLISLGKTNRLTDIISCIHQMEFEIYKY